MITRPRNGSVLDRERLKRQRRLAAVAGVVLALCCKVLPPRYQAPCEAITKIAAISCGGGAS
jgi:hypothetical protein